MSFVLGRRFWGGRSLGRGSVLRGMAGFLGAE